MKNVALITGASSGIGAEFARVHAAKGGDLVLVARREDKLNDLAEEISAKHGTQIKVIAADLGASGGTDKVFAATQAEGIEVSVLINNAGFGLRGKFHEQDWQGNADMIALNVTALAHLTRLYLPAMVARGSGKILNVASTAALVPGPLQSVYFATKAFVHSFSDAIGYELRGTGVTVTTLLPGATESEFAAVSDMDKTPLFAQTTPALEVAEKAYSAMERGDRGVMAAVKGFRRVLMAMLPVLPKSMKLKSVWDAQNV